MANRIMWNNKYKPPAQAPLRTVDEVPSSCQLVISRAWISGETPLNDVGDSTIKLFLAMTIIFHKILFSVKFVYEQ